MPLDRLVEASDLTSCPPPISMIATHLSSQDSLIGSEAGNPTSHSAPINAYTGWCYKCLKLKYYHFKNQKAISLSQESLYQ